MTSRNPNKRTCPYCSKSVTRTKAGTLWAHGEPRCPGSGMITR
jgi:endogenous inhibitor of DNA gyrase (YacG/DUF329 family)